MKRFYAAVPYPKFAKVMDGYLETAPEIEIKPETKLVLFSDWHISGYSKPLLNLPYTPNDFDENILLASHQVLPHYGTHKWRGIYLGDMLELVESTWKKIYAYERNHVVLWQLNDLCIGWDNEGDDIPGNHDRKKHRIDHILFRGIKFPPAIKLVKDGRTIGLLIHGHEADLWNKGGILTGIVNWFVRRVWTIAQCFGVNSESPWSPARNKDKPAGLERHYLRYARERGIVLFCGHTHRPRMRPEYINVGCGTKPGVITCVEIEGSDTAIEIEIRSVYWDEDGRHVTLTAET